MASKRELSFKKYAKPRKGGRWYRKINGKERYYGTGKSKADRESYNDALAKYRSERDKEVVEAQVEDMAKAFFRGKLKAYYGDDALGQLQSRSQNEEGGPAPLPGDLDEWAPSQEDDRHQPGLTDVMLMIERQARRKVLAPTKEEGAKTISDHIDAWLAEEAGRFKAGEIQEVSFLSKSHGIKTFRDFVDGAVFGEPVAVEALLSDYRTLLLGKLEQDQLKGNTVNDKLKFMRQFVKWSYSRRVLHEVPRVMEAVTKQVKVEKGGQPLTWDEVHRLWDHADDRMRCWIALSLNCGFKNLDVAETVGEHIQGGRLLAMRHKEPVPMNYKLWPVSQELIAKTRQDRSGQARLFINKVGNPIVRVGSDNLGSAFKRLTKRAGVIATFEQLRDTGAEFVRTWSRQQKIAGHFLVQLYLAHKDDSTAQYYVSNDPRDVQADVLDQVTDALEKTANLHAL